ncbi:hypothetical protein [Adhaeribacter aquaticus]|uniref:hypothetical protein n=1 Tax=Adhaeribacter aquaticus TaxID=299567 RepID=UPI0012FB6DAB|nr:hypothetical protein [Adhaeribacter aquaticus]
MTETTNNPKLSDGSNQITPSVDNQLEGAIQGENLILDFSKIENLSSSDLSLLLKHQNNNKKIIILNPNQKILRVLEILGFEQLLNVEIKT